MKFARQNPLQKYKVPHRLKFSGELLKNAYESTEKLVAPILAVAKKFGATIASDGWSDQRRRPILNFMASTRGAAAFLNSIDCTDHMAEGGKKDAAYIASNVISVVKKFGAEDVVQIIMDGANKATWPIIIKEFPQIILSWCVAHVIDLWFEDVGKMTFFKDIWEQGKMVVIWIRGHQAFAAKFGKLTQKSLLLPGTGALFLFCECELTCVYLCLQEIRYLGLHSSCLAVKFHLRMKLLSCCMTEN